MPVKFLCNNHREHLLADDHLAENYWLESMHQAAEYHETGDFGSAIPLLGCAAELSGHLLDRSWPNPATALSRFAASVIGLAKTYHLSGNDKAKHYIIEQANERVAASMSDIHCYQLICDSIAVFNWTAVNLAIQRCHKGFVSNSCYSVCFENHQQRPRAVTLH
ncbi:MAG: hypothetical protein V7708_02875 [Oceanicoccus sp.]